MNSANPDPLERLLDAAGRDAQPRGPGWDTLPTRLDARAATARERPLQRWATLPIAVAASAVLALIALWSFTPHSSLQAQERPIEVRRTSVDLTILSLAETSFDTLYMPLANVMEKMVLEDIGGRSKPEHRLTGQALVKDRRLVLHLKAGDNVVRFSDVAATIDPTSVRFESLTDPKGTTVVEQSFEYDLATADALLKRYIDREITCVEKNGQDITGNLASYDEHAIVLTASTNRNEKSTQAINRRSLQAIRLIEKPADLISSPTLVWKLRTKTPGKHDTLLTYICGYMGWHADYVVEIFPGQPGQPDLLDLNGWVTLENTSGSAYPHAGLRLIAGDVRRVRDPWSRDKPPVIDGFYYAPYVDSAKRGARVNFIQGKKVSEFAEQSFFEYHLYTLNTPCTVADHQIKQLKLLQKKGVKATSRRYLFHPQWREKHLAIELLVKNDKENNLGIPLPKGHVTLQQRGDDGELVIVGQCDIDHTAVKEEVKLRYGHAFDVIGEHRQGPLFQIGKTQFYTCESRIRNHKPMPVVVKCYSDQIARGASMINANLPFQVEDFQTNYFEFTLPPNAEQVVRYTIVYRSE